ncbi:MAG: GbsR/MarR family transcriptional regulator [bacterium]
MSQQVQQTDSAGALALVAAQDRFIAVWGQMGSTWGVSRTMAEVHALLFIVGEPMCTDDVMERLAISRGNASMSLRALVDWGILARVHKRGDRKEYFQAEGDPWVILRAVVAERMKREMDPVLAGLAEIRDATEPGRGGGGAVDAAQAGRIASHNDRLDSMIEVLGLLSGLGEKLLGMPTEQLRLAAGALGAGLGGGGGRV